MQSLACCLQWGYTSDFESSIPCEGATTPNQAQMCARLVKMQVHTRCCFENTTPTDRASTVAWLLESPSTICFPMAPCCCSGIQRLKGWAIGSSCTNLRTSCLHFKRDWNSPKQYLKFVYHVSLEVPSAHLDGSERCISAKTSQRWENGLSFCQMDDFQSSLEYDCKLEYPVPYVKVCVITCYHLYY